MKDLKVKILIIFIMTSLQSCDYVTDRIYENKEEQNYVSPFAGKYSGTYKGDINGTLIVTVGEKGGVEIIRSTNDSTENYFTGLINSSFNTTNKAQSGFMLIGNLNSKSGTWTTDNFKGTWTLTKN